MQIERGRRDGQTLVVAKPQRLSSTFILGDVLTSVLTYGLSLVGFNADLHMKKDQNMEARGFEPLILEGVARLPPKISFANINTRTRRGKERSHE